MRFQAVQPSQAAPAFMPPNQNAAAINGSGTTHRGLRLIQTQPSPKSSSQTPMKSPTAHPGAINPEAKKNGARASIAARANPATTYLATDPGLAAWPHRPTFAPRCQAIDVVPSRTSGKRCSHDQVKCRSRVRVVVPGDVMEEQPFGACGDRGASSPWITRAELSEGGNSRRLHCSAAAS